MLEKVMPQNEKNSQGGEPAELHAQVLREKPDPVGGNAPVSLWFLVLSLAFAMWGGGYLCAYSGAFRGDVFSDAAFDFGQGAEAGPAKASDPLVKGKKLFVANCANCHEKTGLGKPGIYPPLAGSEYVVGPQSQLVPLVLHGLQGAITVKGVVFNGSMPTWKQLKDDQIATILTYIRQEW
jgi:mono/diheme cytochrome c family protein